MARFKENRTLYHASQEEEFAAITTMSSREGNNASKDADSLDMVVEVDRRVEGVVVSCPLVSSMSLSKRWSRCAGGLAGEEVFEESGLS